MSKKVQMRFYKIWYRFYKWIIGLVIICFAIFLFFSIFRLKDIHMEENDYYSKEEITAYLQENGWDNNTLLFYIKMTYQSELDVPFIEKIDFHYIDRNTIGIEIYEKPMVGCVEYMNEYIYFDKDGKVLEISKERLDEIPLFSGVSFREMKLYETLNVSDDTIFEIIKNISQMIQRYNLEVDHVVIDTKNSVTFYVNKISILLGERTSYDDAIAELESILPQISELEGELDMRNYVVGQSQIIFKEKK